MTINLPGSVVLTAMELIHPSDHCRRYLQLDSSSPPCECSSTAAAHIAHKGLPGLADDYETCRMELCPEPRSCEEGANAHSRLQSILPRSAISVILTGISYR